MALVYLGIGSNVGDRRAHVKRAIELLKEHEEIDVLQVSDLVENAAVGGPPQGDFLNGAVKIKTDLMPLDLLSQLKMIERRLGRTKHEPNEPRTMDLDILFYDDVVIVEGKSLTIPHPRLHERRFVLGPLALLAPELVHPRLGVTVKELEARLSDEAHPQPAGA